MYSQKRITQLNISRKAKRILMFKFTIYQIITLVYGIILLSIWVYMLLVKNLPAIISVDIVKIRVCYFIYIYIYNYIDLSSGKHHIYNLYSPYNTCTNVRTWGLQIYCNGA